MERTEQELKRVAREYAERVAEQLAAVWAAYTEEEREQVGAFEELLFA